MLFGNLSGWDRARLAVGVAVVLLSTGWWLGRFEGTGENWWSHADPRLRRYWREQAVAYVGRSRAAREFVEMRGDNAAVAVLSCSRGVARELAKFHDQGSFEQLPRSDDLLCAIGEPNHGDTVCRFVMANASSLADARTCDVFLKAPLEYALSLRSLTDEAAISLDDVAWNDDGLRTAVMATGTVVVLGLFVWRYRRYGRYR